MFKCHVCGSSESHTEYVSEVLKLATSFILSKIFLLLFVLAVEKRFLAMKHLRLLELCCMENLNQLSQLF